MLVFCLAPGLAPAGGTAGADRESLPHGGTNFLCLMPCPRVSEKMQLLTPTCIKHPAQAMHMPHTYGRGGSRVGSTGRVGMVPYQSRDRKAGEMGRLWPKALVQQDTAHRLWLLLFPRLCTHMDVQSSLPKPPQLLVSAHGGHLTPNLLRTPLFMQNMLPYTAPKPACF